MLLTNLTVLESAVGIILLAVAVIAFVIYSKTKKTNIAEIEKFLVNLSDTIIVGIVDTIKNIDTHDFPTFEEFEKELLEKIYNDCFIYIKTTIEKAFDENGDKFLKYALTYLTYDKVKEFIDSLIEKIDGKSLLQAKYMDDRKDEIENEDKELEAKFSNSDEYVEEINPEDLESATVTIPTEEELAKLNPPKDEDEDYDSDDDSMELLPEPEIVVEQDKNGKDIYYEIDETGKKKRVSKEYAISKMI